jgi:uncharacterized protein YjdB
VSGDGQVTLKWAAPVPNGSSQLNSYEISKDNGLTWINIGNVTSYIFANLTNGTAYTFKVRAVNSAGAGAFAIVVATPVSAGSSVTVPDIPQNFIVSAGDTKVVLAWSAPASDGGGAITAYQVSKDGGQSWTSIGNVLSYTFTSLSNGTAYTFKVRAVNAAGAGASATVAAIPRALALEGVSKPAIYVTPVTGIRLAQKSFALKKGKSLKLPVAVYTADKTKAKLTFASSNPKVAKVSAKGKVTAKKKGKATIKITAANGKSASVKVYVLKKSVKIKKVTLVKAPKKLKKNRAVYLKVRISPKKATGVVVKFKSSKPKVISVDKAGKLTALKKGKATITVSAGGKKVRVRIKVTK